MSRTTTLLALAAGTTALLTACGSGTSVTPVAPIAAPQVATSTATAPSTDEDLTAVPHLDDGDGVFDESHDPAVLDDDDDQDDDDIEDGDFDHRVA